MSSFSSFEKLYFDSKICLSPSSLVTKDSCQSHPCSSFAPTHELHSFVFIVPFYIPVLITDMGNAGSGDPLHIIGWPTTLSCFYCELSSSVAKAPSWPEFVWLHGGEGSQSSLMTRYKDITVRKETSWLVFSLRVFEFYKALSQTSPTPLPFRRVQATTITSTPSPTKPRFVTLIASEEFGISR